MNSLRKEIIENLLKSLEEGQLPWRKEWSSLSSRPFNAVTQSSYHGVNAFWLLYQQYEKGYQDPRWCTFKQAQNSGWSIKKGEKGTRVEFWSLYDKETKKKMTLKEANELQKQISAEEYLERVKPISSVYTVFNGEQIEGIPEIELEKYIWDSKELLEKRDILLTNMKVDFLEQGWEAYYLPSRDLISLPEVTNFENEYAYFSTLLHEAAHATGHSSRFDREFGKVGSHTYAREELRAEIASAFTTQALGIDSENERHMENHKAYVKSWISILKEKPEELFAAIRDAEKISDYLIEKGKFQLFLLPDKTTLYENIQNLAKIENELNTPTDERLTSWFGDMLTYEKKIGVTPEQIVERLQEIQQSYVCKYEFSYHDVTRDKWKSTIVEAASLKKAEELFLDARNNSDYYQGLELATFKKEKNTFISYNAEGKEVSRYENIKLKNFMPIKERPQLTQNRKQQERMEPKYVR